MLHNIKKSIQGEGNEPNIRESNTRQTLEHTLEKPEFETYEQSKMVAKIDTEENY